MSESDRNFNSGGTNPETCAEISTEAWARYQYESSALELEAAEEWVQNAGWRKTRSRRLPLELEAAEEWVQKRKRVYRAQRLRHFGRNPADYEKILRTQKGCCPICGKALTEINTVMDHDHKTGGLRALLCRKCNSGLGFFNDDPRLMRRAASYAVQHRRAFWARFLVVLPAELIAGVQRAMRRAR